MIQTKKINGVDVSYTIANPRVDDIHASFKLGATVKELGQSEKADVAANLNYADNNTGTPIGRVVVGGKTVISDIDKTVLRDELYMLPNKSLHIGKAPKEALWALQGSPPLLRNGVNVVAKGIERDRLGTDIWQGKAYRLAVGITTERNLVIARTKQVVTLDALAAIMAALGCVDALNGDGGGSAYLWPDDNGWGRKMGAALIVKKGVDKDMSKPILIIDPGHGGTDPGASGNGIVEKDYTLKISQYQFKRFEELGLAVALTRDNDRSLDSVQRTNIVKDSGAKFCISNHINAATSTAATGVEAIRSIHSEGTLATALVGAVAAAGQVKRPTPVITKTQSDGQDWYFMQRLTGSVSTVTLEYGFCTNVNDAKLIKDKWQEFAEAAVRAFCLFVGHKYTAPITEPVKPLVTPPVKPVEPPVQTVEGFTDIAGHWAQATIIKAVNAGVLVGVSADKFAPDQPLTRAQTAVLLDRLGLLDKGVK